MRIPADVNSSESRAGKSVQLGKLVQRVEPTYPAEAAQRQIQGTVKLHAAINADGTIQNVEANGPPQLAEAAMNAVRRWRYTPTILGGTPIEADEDIVFVFRLSSATATTNPSP
jgi:TonB family protein